MALLAALGWARANPPVPASIPSPRPAEPSPQPERIYADSFLVWIYSQPERDLTPIGYLRAGQSARLRSVDGRDRTKPYKKGCGKGWYAVEPAGFVCLDARASLAPTRYTQSMIQLAPEPGAYPFEFALSMGTPSYRRLPTQEQWKRKERIFGAARPRPLPPHWRGHEELVGSDEAPELSEPFSFLLDGGSVSRQPENRLVRRDVPFGSMLAVAGAFTHEDRTFLQSADGTIVPADRMRLFRRSEFEGVQLGEATGLSLPLAWPRQKTRLYSTEKTADCTLPGTTKGEPGLEHSPDPQVPLELAKSCLVPTAHFVEPRLAIPLSGRIIEVAGTRFLELANENRFLPENDLYLAERRPAPGNGTEPDGSVRKWLHFRISEGTLVAYVGQAAVFATLASPGIGGVPAAGADPLETRTTPLGTYRIQFKHRSDDMSPEQGEHRKFWIADVPFAQYFQQPFAIHVAYWHDSFGEPMSGGCINVSPKDGERLFGFTDPPLPPEWYGVGASREFGLGTTLVVER